MKYLQSIALLVVSVIFLVPSCKTDPSQKETAQFKRTVNEVIVRLDGEPDRLNPLLSTTGYGSQVSNQIFNFLLFIDPQTLELTPSLLKSRPEITELEKGPFAGGASYAFEIHEEAVWDDGSPVTAYDYIFTLKAALNPEVPAARYRPYLNFIRDIVVDAGNPKKFTVFSDIRYILGEDAASSTIPVFPEYVYDPEGLLKDIEFTTFTDPQKLEALAQTDPRLKQFAEAFTDTKFDREVGFVSGSGPYKLESWETGISVALNKKENWWGDALADKYPALQAFPDKLIFKPVSDAGTALAALKSEEIDVSGNINPKDFMELRDNEAIQKIYNFHTPLSLAVYFIYVNTENPKLSDKRVRQALAYAVDKDKLIETLYYNFGEKTAGPVHPSKTYYNTDLDFYDYDIEKAKALLKEARWEDTNDDGIVDKEIEGERVEMNLRYTISANRESSKNMGLLFKDNLKKIGVNIELDPMEFNVNLANLRKGDYELSGGGRRLSPTLWEPGQNWHTQGDNRTGFGNAETDALIDKIKVTLDDDERNALYKELQAIIHDEQCEIYLFVPQGRIAIHKRFEAGSTAFGPGFLPNMFKIKD